MSNSSLMVFICCDSFIYLMTKKAARVNQRKRPRGLDPELRLPKAQGPSDIKRRKMRPGNFLRYTITYMTTEVFRKPHYVFLCIWTYRCISTLSATPTAIVKPFHGGVLWCIPSVELQLSHISDLRHEAIFTSSPWRPLWSVKV